MSLMGQSTLQTKKNYKQETHTKKEKMSSTHRQHILITFCRGWGKGIINRKIGKTADEKVKRG